MNMLSKILTGLLLIVFFGWGLTTHLKNKKIDELKNLNSGLKAELEIKLKEKTGFEAAMQLQDAKVKELEIDIEKSKTSLQTQNQAITKKYDAIKASAQTCEAELIAIKKITEVFYASESD